MIQDEKELTGQITRGGYSWKCKGRSVLEKEKMYLWKKERGENLVLNRFGAGRLEAAYSGRFFCTVRRKEGLCQWEAIRDWIFRDQEKAWIRWIRLGWEYDGNLMSFHLHPFFKFLLPADHHHQRNLSESHVDCVLGSILPSKSVLCFYWYVSCFLVTESHNLNIVPLYTKSYRL